MFERFFHRSWLLDWFRPYVQVQVPLCCSSIVVLYPRVLVVWYKICRYLRLLIQLHLLCCFREKKQHHNFAPRGFAALAVCIHLATAASCWYLRYPAWCYCKWSSWRILTLNQSLVGGNSNIFYFHPENWGRFPIWLIFFRRGWNHQLDHIWQDKKTTVIYLRDIMWKWFWILFRRNLHSIRILYNFGHLFIHAWYLYDLIYCLYLSQ